MAELRNVFSISNKEIEEKFSEINNAISILNKQKEEIDKLIEKDINDILNKKILEHKKNLTVQDYMKKNPTIIDLLREKLKVKYCNFIDDNMRILEKAKERLFIVKNL